MNEEKTVKETRETRRLREEKHNLFNTLINLFIAERSASPDPEGEEVDKAFVKYRNMWIDECKKFNKGKNRSFTLRGNAFTDAINTMIEKERIAQIKANQEKEERDFGRYLTKEQITEGRMLEYVKRYFFRNLWYKVISLGNKEKTLKKWKQYYGKLKK